MAQATSVTLWIAGRTVHPHLTILMPQTAQQLAITVRPGTGLHKPPPLILSVLDSFTNVLVRMRHLSGLTLIVRSSYSYYCHSDTGTGQVAACPLAIIAKSSPSLHPPAKLSAIRCPTDEKNPIPAGI